MVKISVKYSKHTHSNKDTLDEKSRTTHRHSQKHALDHLPIPSRDSQKQATANKSREHNVDNTPTIKNKTSTGPTAIAKNTRAHHREEQYNSHNPTALATTNRDRTSEYREQIAGNTPTLTQKQDRPACCQRCVREICLP
jgi:hypothetical protein